MRRFIEMYCEGENSHLGESFLKGFIFIKKFSTYLLFFSVKKNRSEKIMCG